VRQHYLAMEFRESRSAAEAIYIHIASPERCQHPGRPDEPQSIHAVLKIQGSNSNMIIRGLRGRVWGSIAKAIPKA
jgi:hypothetical protein